MTADSLDEALTLGTVERPLQFNTAALTIRQAFPTPVVIAPVEDAASLNATLARIILARAAASPGVHRSNDGGWQSNDDLQLWAGASGALLLDAARRLVDHYTGVQTEAGMRHAPIAWRVNAWANVNARGDTNLPHHHPGAFWSMVYWVDAGEEDQSYGGEFEMHDPRGVLPGMYAPTLRYAMAGCLSAGSSDFVEPRTGTMLLFPSWLVHSVRRFHGRRPRISIACNFAV